MKSQTKSKIRCFFIRVWKYPKALGEYLLFPHILTCIIILLLAILTLWFSFTLKDDNSYWSSILANIAAGLFTGIVICLVAGIKQISILRLQMKIEWLDKLKEYIIQYQRAYPTLYSLHFQEFDGDEELDKTIYEISSYANWINDFILQSTYDRKYLFDPRKYCRKQLQYDAYTLVQDFETLHEQLGRLSFDCPSSKQILQYFEKVNKQIEKLSHELYKTRNQLEIRLSRLQNTLI